MIWLIIDLVSFQGLGQHLGSAVLKRMVYVRPQYGLLMYDVGVHRRFGCTTNTPTADLMYHRRTSTLFPFYYLFLISRRGLWLRFMWLRFLIVLRRCCWTRVGILAVGSGFTSIPLPGRLKAWGKNQSSCLTECIEIQLYMRYGLSLKRLISP